MERKDEKLEKYKKYGWTVSEENLATLPKEAPQAAKDLARWLTLEGRRRSLTEWLGEVRDDSRIHGKFWHIGAWTQRMAHTKPNSANIASPFHIPEGKTEADLSPVELVKYRYDNRMRGLWKPTPGKVLVGTDADAAQLRVLTNIMKSQTWLDAIEKGDKKLGTDIHSMNRKALGHVCKDRDTAKTFVYGWLLGASIPKIAEILSCSVKEAGEANQSFLDYFPELKRVKNLKIPQDAARGYFVGIDGRKVPCDSEHLMLAGYLQSGEAILMKAWVREWRMMCRKEGLPFKMVNFVHDEVQVEVDDVTSAEELMAIQHQAIDNVSKHFNLFCPFRVDPKAGYSWTQTH